MKYPEEKKKKDKQWCTKHYTEKTNNDLQNTKQKIADWTTRTPQKKAEMKPDSDVIKSCSTNSNRRTIVTNSVINHEWGNDGIMITPIGIYPLLFVTQIFHKDRFIDWLVIAYRPERSISAIFRTRTSSMIYRN
jgi:hypothetical protein